jgi:hypothetical protein
MSGPLADWVLAHSKASHYGRCFLASAALRANHVGEGAGLSVDQVAEQWRIGETSAHEGRREVLALGELVRVSRGGGRGNVPRYRIPVAYCPAEADCWECGVLKGCATRTLSQQPKPERKGAPRGRKGAPGGVKGAPGAPPTGTGDGSPLQGEPSPPGGEDDARSSATPQSGSAARSGEQAARDKIVERNREVEASRPEHGQPPPAGMRPSELLRRQDE